MENTRDSIIDQVLEQIKKDVEIGDLTAIEQLINYLPTDILIHYLPE